MKAAVITLASASPRRREILDNLSLDFKVVPVDIDERFTGVSAEEQAVLLAEQKMHEFRRLHAHEDHPWILTADTIVECSGRKIGKPQCEDEARDFLKLFSGNTHRVLTGLAFHSAESGTGFASAITEVDFAPLTEEEIRNYIATGEWKGVAAGYRIQEKGACLISAIRGSYSNVMGLPIHTFYGMLKRYNYPFPW